MLFEDYPPAPSEARGPERPSVCLLRCSVTLSPRDLKAVGWKKSVCNCVGLAMVTFLSKVLPEIWLWMDFVLKEISLVNLFDFGLS
jgi:hypothetical protein